MFLLGLGSNLPSSFGDRFKNIDLAISYMESYKITLVKKSSFYETPSYPDLRNPKFINIVIGISTDLIPIDLAAILFNIEKKLERKRIVKNEPRTCDIDILDYKGKIINFNYKDSTFKIPHEKLVYRNFVLYPLREIEPNWKHPRTKETIDVLINKLSEVDKKSISKVSNS